MGSDKAYLELLKSTLTDFHRMEYGEFKPLYDNKGSLQFKLLLWFDRLIRKKNYHICRHINYNPEDRLEGRDWPSYADTMIGIKRLNNIQYCMEEISKGGIKGDIIETGVWRGGASIFMKALMNVLDLNDRVLWLADSFKGLPAPDNTYSEDKGDSHHTMDELAVGLDIVKSNFSKYGLLDQNVKFLEGWFKDTLPDAPIEKLALLRLDGDMYESTMDGFTNLYPKLSKGGFVIIDDWGAVEGCKQATIDFREKNNINDEIITIDWGGVFWRKG